MVEMTGVEPVSENKSTPVSTGVGYGQDSLGKNSTTKVLTAVVSNA